MDPAAGNSTWRVGFITAGRGRANRSPASTQEKTPSGEGLSGLLEGAVGNVVVRRLERASADLLAVLAQFVARSTELRDRGLFALTSRPIPELRARSLAFEQLLGRSSGALLEIPPLRARRDEIGTLARAFVAEAADRYNKALRGLSARALVQLEQHPFPGNVRELGAIIECAVLRSTGDWLTVDDLGLEPVGATKKAGAAQLTIRLPGSSLRDIELRAVKLALELADGRLVRAAELLGVTRHALRRKLEKFGIEDLRTWPVSSSDRDETPDDDSYI